MIPQIISKNWLRSFVRADDPASQLCMGDDSGDDFGEIEEPADSPVGDDGGSPANETTEFVAQREELEEEEEETEGGDVAEENANGEAGELNSGPSVVSDGTDDPLAPAYDLDDGELIEEDLHAERKTRLPWSSRVQNAKDFFMSELLYRFDLLEHEEKKQLAGKYRFEIKGYQGGVWTLDLGDELNIVNRREDAEIVLTMYQRDFLQLVNGELNPQLALVAQKIKVGGDFRKVVAFQSLLVPLRD